MQLLQRCRVGDETLQWAHVGGDMVGKDGVRRGGLRCRSLILSLFPSYFVTLVNVRHEGPRLTSLTAHG